jgi:hypothetical protein
MSAGDGIMNFDWKNMCMFACVYDSEQDKEKASQHETIAPAKNGQR